MFLSRILDPKDFGYMAITMYWFNLAQTFSNLGFHHIIVLSQDITKKNISQIFWFNLLFSTGLFSIFFFGSGWFEQFYHLEQVGVLITFLSFNFLTSALLMVPQALLHKSERFKTQSIIQVISVFIGFGVAIIGAWYTKNYIFLAIQQLATGAVNLILHVIYTRWWPVMAFSLEYIVKNRKFTGNLFSVYILEYLAQNLDNLIIGKVSNEHTMGLYNRSSLFSILPVQNFTAAIAKVLLPKLSRMHIGTKDFSQEYDRYFKLILSSVSLLMLFLISIDTYFISIFFGEKWLPMTPYFDLFCLLGIFSSILTYIDIVLLSTRRSFALLLFIIAEKVLLTCAILIGFQWGIFGILAGKTIFTVLLYLPKNFFMSKIIQSNFNYYMVHSLKILLLPILLCALAYVVKLNAFELHYWLKFALISALWLGGFLLFDKFIMHNLYLNQIKERFLKK